MVIGRVKKCKAFAKNEYKLVLVNEIIMAENCPLLQKADNIIKKSVSAHIVLVWFVSLENLSLPAAARGK